MKKKVAAGPMYRHILIPTDGSPLSLKAARAGTRLASHLGAKVTALYVVQPYKPPYLGDESIITIPYSEREYLAGMRKFADRAIAKVKAAARAHDVICTGAMTVDAAPWEGIIKAAGEKKCDLIVMASHGRRGLAGVILGSETAKVLTHSKTPVLVCR